jgi:hypothetical protein
MNLYIQSVCLIIIINSKFFFLTHLIFNLTKNVEKRIYRDIKYFLKNEKELKVSFIIKHSNFIKKGNIFSNFDFNPL